MKVELPLNKETQPNPNHAIHSFVEKHFNFIIKVLEAPSVPFSFKVLKSGFFFKKAFYVS